MFFSLDFRGDEHRVANKNQNSRMVMVLLAVHKLLRCT